MSRDSYLPPKALREIEDPTSPEPADLVEAIRGHILASASVTGTYTLNPDLR